VTEPVLAPAALVLTQVAAPEGLAAACAMSKVDVDSVPTEIGAVAVCRSLEPGGPERAAEVISGLLRNTPVVLLTHRDGQMTATRWAEGHPGDAVSPLLMLDGAPAVVEELLLGQTGAADVPGMVSSVGMSRWQATRILASAARSARRRPGRPGE
jgi:hypothetical protein